MAKITREGKTPPWIGAILNCPICECMFSLEQGDSELVHSVKHENFGLMISVCVRCPNCRAECWAQRSAKEYEQEK